MHFYPPKALFAALQFIFLGAVVVTSGSNSPGLKDRQFNVDVEAAPVRVIVRPGAVQPGAAAPGGSMGPDKRGRSTCSRSCERHLRPGAGKTTAG
jgi:hypothetical protein